MVFNLIVFSFLGIIVFLLIRIYFNKNKRIKELEQFPKLNPNFVLQLKSPKVITAHNPSAARYFKKDVDWSDIDLKLTEELFNKIVNGNLHIQYQVFHNNKSFLIDYVGSQKLGKINAYGTDITELNNLRQEIFQNNKLAAVGVLASGVGHEINNPLSIALNALDFIKRDWNEHEQCKYIEIQNNALKRIEKIVHGLRVYAREDKELDEVFDLHEAIKDTFELLNEIYKKESINISLGLNASCSSIKGNYGRFQQVIMNIVSNAKDAIKDSKIKEIHITTYNLRDKTVIEIKDFGKGIPLEIQDKIFDAFFTTKKIGKGTGIGLGITKKIVSEMSGDIKINSVIEKGSTFTISLPKNLNEKHNNHPNFYEKTETSKISGTLLLVEDEVDLGELLKEKLEASGLKVYFSNNGEKALEVLSENLSHIEFVLTDYKMPKLSGLEWTTKAKEKFNCSHIKFILMSGAIDLKISKNFDKLISKPINEEDLFNFLSENKKLTNIA